MNTELSLLLGALPPAAAAGQDGLRDVLQLCLAFRETPRCLATEQAETTGPSTRRPDANPPSRSQTPSAALSVSAVNIRQSTVDRSHKEWIAVHPFVYSRMDGASVCGGPVCPTGTLSSPPRGVQAGRRQPMFSWNVLEDWWPAAQRDGQGPVAAGQPPRRGNAGGGDSHWEAGYFPRPAARLQLRQHSGQLQNSSPAGGGSWNEVASRFPAQVIRRPRRDFQHRSAAPAAPPATGSLQAGDDSCTLPYMT